MALPAIARQYPLFVFVDMVFGDWPLTAIAVNLFSIPLNSTITQIAVVIETAFAAAGDYDADIGDITDPNRYTQTIAEFDATGTPTNAPAVDLSFLTTSAEPNVNFTPVYTTDPTAGEARLLFEYVQEDRANETDG